MKFKFFLSAIFFVLVVGLMGCSRPPTHPPVVKKSPPPYAIDGKIYYPLGEVGGYVERGIASWYGEKFHGRKTSSGEVYNMYAKTAAHRTLPFGTHIQVTNLTNGKKTTARINDRGPFVKDRIIDLSYAGAQEIGLIGPGTASVEIKVSGLKEAGNQDKKPINAPASTQIYWTGNFTVQIGAFEDLKNAVRLKEELSRLYASVYITTFDTKGRVFYRVRVGKYDILQETIQAQKELESRGYRDTFVVAE